MQSLTFPPGTGLRLCLFFGNDGGSPQSFPSIQRKQNSYRGTESWSGSTKGLRFEKSDQGHRGVGSQADKQRGGQLLFVWLQLRAGLGGRGLTVGDCSLCLWADGQGKVRKLHLACLLHSFPLHQVAIFPPHPPHTIQVQRRRPEKKEEYNINPLRFLSPKYVQNSRCDGNNDNNESWKRDDLVIY